MVFRRHRGRRTTRWQEDLKQKALEQAAREGESPVSELSRKPSGILSNAGHEKSCANQRGPSRKAKPIANQYREGKVKRTPNRGVKKTLNPSAYKRSEHRKV